jgi:hypothetical protein
MKKILSELRVPSNPQIYEWVPSEHKFRALFNEYDGQIIRENCHIACMASCAVHLYIILIILINTVGHEISAANR